MYAQQISASGAIMIVEEVNTTTTNSFYSSPSDQLNNSSRQTTLSSVVGPSIPEESPSNLRGPTSNSASLYPNPEDVHSVTSATGRQESNPSDDGADVERGNVRTNVDGSSQRSSHEKQRSSQLNKKKSSPNRRPLVFMGGASRAHVSEPEQVNNDNHNDAPTDASSKSADGRGGWTRKKCWIAMAVVVVLIVIGVGAGVGVALSSSSSSGGEDKPVNGTNTASFPPEEESDTPVSPPVAAPSILVAPSPTPTTAPTTTAAPSIFTRCSLCPRGAGPPNPNLLSLIDGETCGSLAGLVQQFSEEDCAANQRALRSNAVKCECLAYEDVNGDGKVNDQDVMQPICALCQAITVVNGTVSVMQPPPFPSRTVTYNTTDNETVTRTCEYLHENIAYAYEEEQCNTFDSAIRQYSEECGC